MGFKTICLQVLSRACNEDHRSLHCTAQLDAEVSRTTELLQWMLCSWWPQQWGICAWSESRSSTSTWCGCPNGTRRFCSTSLWTVRNHLLHNNWVKLTVKCHKHLNLKLQNTVESTYCELAYSDIPLIVNLLIVISRLL